MNSQPETRTTSSRPAKAAAFDEMHMQCQLQRRDVQLCWQREMCADGCTTEPLVAGTSALGVSFIESYGVWYELCARATVGNAAFMPGGINRTCHGGYMAVTFHPKFVSLMDGRRDPPDRRYVHLHHICHVSHNVSS